MVMHQKFVNLLAEVRDENGISRITQQEIARQMNRSPAWVKKAIKRLNTEDLCIESIGRGEYRLLYDNLRSQGVFSKIIAMYMSGTESLYEKKDTEIMYQYECKLRTVQMYKSYIKMDLRRFFQMRTITEDDAEICFDENI